MSETTDFEKTQKSKQYLKIAMSETTDFKSNTKVIGGYCDMWVFLDFCLFLLLFQTS